MSKKIFLNNKSYPECYVREWHHDFRNAYVIVTQKMLGTISLDCSRNQKKKYICKTTFITSDNKKWV